MTTLEYAKYYVSKGFSVIPLKPKDKKPVIETWKPYQEKKPSMGELKEWFDNSYNYNIGIVTGQISGIVVVDLDSEEAKIFSKENKFPETPVVTTGKGYHLYYKYQNGVRNFQKRDDLPDIDLRGDGGYVVAPPSLHPSGKIYKWIEHHSINDLPFAELPEIILANPPSDKKPLRELYQGVSKGSRNETLARLTGSWVNDGLSLKDCLENASIWNEKNNPPLPDDEVIKTVKSIFNKHNSTSGIVIQEPWQNPISLDYYSSLPNFPTEVLPSPGKEMVETVAEINQVDEGLPGSLYLSVLSTCLSKKGIVNLGTHKEPLNLYLCSIAGSGERKTSTVNIMTKPIYEYQKHLQQNISEKIIDTSNEIRIKEAIIKRFQKEASETDNIDERTKLKNDIIALAKEIEENPVPENPVLVIDDITTEALGVSMTNNNERMAILSAEGGIFRIIAGQYSEKDFNIDLYLKAHPGDPWSSHRVTRKPISMESPSLTIGLAVQPDVIQEIGKNKSFRGRGLLARFLYSRNKSLVGYRLRQQKQISGDIKKQYKKHIIELLNIPLTLIILTLSQEAQKIWDEFYNDVEPLMLPGGDLDTLQDWGSKLPGAVARIAGLLHFAKHGEDVTNKQISVETVSAAISIGSYYLEHARAVFGLMREDASVESAKKILEYIEKHKPDSLKGRDVIRHKNFFKTMNEVSPGLKVLIERGYIRNIKTEYSTIGRPEAASYVVNPKLKSKKIIDNIDKTI